MNTDNSKVMDIKFKMNISMNAESSIKHISYYKIIIIIIFTSCEATFKKMNVTVIYRLE